MPSWYPARQLERNDRYVQRCHVRGGGQESRTRLQFSIEEALRLISLPGENEGRIYYFRHVRISGVSPHTKRQEWIDAFQAALVALSSQAIHGSDPRAADAEAVFFQSHQEALEALLAKTLRGDPAEAWFWQQAIGAEQAHRAGKVLAIIQRLSELPASWSAVADSVLAAIGSNDPSAMLAMLPPSVINGWLQELGREHFAGDHLRPVYLRQTVAGMLLRSARALGSGDARVTWLAALAVLQAAPVECSSGAVVGRARITLQSLLAERAPAALHRRGEAIRPRQMATSDSPEDPETLRFESGVSRTRVRFTDPEEQPAQDGAAAVPPPGAAPPKVSNVEFPQQTRLPDSAMNELPAPATELQGAADDLNSLSIADSNDEPISSVYPRPVSLGEATEAAGLLFLLNALSRLGIAETLDRNPVAAEQGLVAHIMQRLALHAGVEERDPAWRWMDSLLSQIPPAGARFPAGPELFPSNLRPRPGTLVDMQYLSRAWCAGVRRWCWHTGGITVREVVHRHGLLSLNGTDFDVTLPLSSAELRIRRVGLDIDPGWLPWFGKVVRFHYV